MVLVVFVRRNARRFVWAAKPLVAALANAALRAAICAAGDSGAVARAAGLVANAEGE